MEETQILLARLDLSRPGMERVRAASDNPAAAARELLAYYRARTSVTHPDARRRKQNDELRPIASDNDILVADDAVKNILIASPAYPRHDFGDKIDWFTNRSPNNDLEWLVQLHRHYSWTPLGRAYQHSGDEKYAQAYVRQLLDWLDNCPVEETGRTAWGTLETGIRGHAWTMHWHWFLDSPHYTPAILVRQLNSFYDHAQRLTAKRSFSKNNWGLMEAEGAAFIGVIFPEFKEAGEWRHKGFAYLAEQIDKQVFADGMHHEMCFGYHCGAIAWFTRTLDLARANGLGDQFPAHYSATIEKMYEALGRCLHPNGHHSMFGDDQSRDVRHVIRRGAGAFPGNKTLAFLAGQGNTPALPTAFALPDAGIYSLRSGWDEDAVHLVLKCGADGGWHCQPDNGTFELYAFGRYLMPDSGCYIYHGDGRQWFRQTRAHQTLTLDNRNSKYKARQLLWKTDSRLDVVAVENQSYSGLVHRRVILFVNKAFFVIVDDALGTGAGMLDLRFQFAPGKIKLDAPRGEAHSLFEGQGNALILGAMQPGMTMEAEEGQVSFVYGKKEPRPGVKFSISKDATMPATRFVTLVVPYRDKRPEAALTTLDLEDPGSPCYDGKVTIDGVSFCVGFDLETGAAYARPWPGPGRES